MSNNQDSRELSGNGWGLDDITLAQRSPESEHKDEPTTIFDDFVKAHSGAYELQEDYEKEKTHFSRDWAIRSSSPLAPVDRVRCQTRKYTDEYGKAIQGKAAYSFTFYIGDVYLFKIEDEPNTPGIIVETLADEGNEVRMRSQQIEAMITELFRLETDGLLVELSTDH